jgi:hypothetical protein
MTNRQRQALADIHAASARVTRPGTGESFEGAVLSSHGGRSLAPAMDTRCGRVCGTVGMHGSTLRSLIARGLVFVRVIAATKYVGLTDDGARAR